MTTSTSSYPFDIFRYVGRHWNAVQRKGFKRIIPATFLLGIIVILMNDLAYTDGKVTSEWPLWVIGFIGLAVPFLIFEFMLKFETFTLAEFGVAVYNRFNPRAPNEKSTALQKASQIARDFIFFASVMLMFDFSETPVILAIFLIIVLSTMGISGGIRNTIMGTVSALMLIYVLSVPVGLNDDIDNLVAGAGRVYAFIAGNSDFAKFLTVTGFVALIAGSFSDKFRGFITNGKTLLRLAVALAALVAIGGYLMSDDAVEHVEAVGTQYERFSLFGSSPAAAATPSAATPVTFTSGCGTEVTRQPSTRYILRNCEQPTAGQQLVGSWVIVDQSGERRPQEWLSVSAYAPMPGPGGEVRYGSNLRTTVTPPAGETLYAVFIQEGDDPNLAVEVAMAGPVIG